jgi:hypothetical protein
MNSFNSFSQTDIKVILSPETARLVIKDLLEGDSAKRELALTKVLLQRVEEKVILQNQAIENLTLQKESYFTMYTKMNNAYELQNDISFEWEKKYKIEKRKVWFYAIVGIAGVLVTSQITK